MNVRKPLRGLASALSTSAFIASLAAHPALACTGIRLVAADGSVVDARTMEFAIDIQSKVTMVPRGTVRTGTTPDGKPGLGWTAKYASVGMNGLGMPILFD